MTLDWPTAERWLITHRARLAWHSADRPSVEYWDEHGAHVIVVGRIVDDRAETALELVARVMGGER